MPSEAPAMEWLAILIAVLAAFWLSKSFGVLGVLAAFGALIVFRVWLHARRLNKTNRRRGSTA
jgi:NhaP-type Na+/H+ or K+/H+ antiporter